MAQWLEQNQLSRLYFYGRSGQKKKTRKITTELSELYMRITYLLLITFIIVVLFLKLVNKIFFNSWNIGPRWGCIRPSGKDIQSVAQHEVFPLNYVTPLMHRLFIRLNIHDPFSTKPVPNRYLFSWAIYQRHIPVFKHQSRCMFADFTFTLRIKRFEEFSEVGNFLFR